MADTGSVTKAAQINNVTPPGVSQQIRSLNRHFKSVLIERSKTGFRLTKEGEVLYDYSKQLNQIYDLLRLRLQGINDIMSGTIHVATIGSIGLHDLPPYLKKFLRLFPNVTVHVKYRRTNQVYEEVLGNVADFGLVVYPTPDLKLDIIPLRRDALVLICHPNHPLAKEKSVKLSQLAGEKFIGCEANTPTRKAIDKILEGHNVAVETVMQCDNIETIKRLVEIEAGISIVPQATITQEVARQTLAEVKIEGRNLHRPLAAIYKKNKVLTPAMKKFLAMLKS